MKRIIVFLMAICMMVPYAEAQNNKALRKALKKEYKAKMKEYKKGGWQIMGSRSLDVADVIFLDHLGLEDPRHLGIATPLVVYHTGLADKQLRKTLQRIGIKPLPIPIHLVIAKPQRKYIYLFCGQFRLGLNIDGFQLLRGQ